MEKVTRRSFMIGISVTAASFLFGGCSGLNTNASIPVAVEPLGPSTKREIGNKYLHVHSLQQQLMLLGAQSGQRIYFKSGSDDAFVSDSVPDNFSLALSSALNRDYLSITWKKMGSSTKRLDIKNNSVSVYQSLAKKHIKTKTLTEEDGLSGDFLVRSDKDTSKIVASLGVSEYEFFPLQFIFNRVYTQGKRLGTDVYFSYSGKEKVLFFLSKPNFTYLTPYKRQLFVNFLDARGILYKSNRSGGIAIADNFKNWAIGMDKLERINKYRHAVYGIFDGHNFFEVADSNYRDPQITVEMIDWTPDGKREYNIYYKGHHRKVITDQRFIHYYSPDGKTKYLIRFY